NNLDEKIIKDIVIKSLNLLNNKVSIGVSNRHIHLCKRDLEELFGVGYELTPLKMLTQPGEYACKETLTIKGPNGIIENVRILGPIREHTQVEILQSDTCKLEVKAGIKLSGDLNNTPGIILISKLNVIKIEKGVIVAKSHIHIDEEQAMRLNLCDKQNVNVEVKGDRSIIFKNVAVRVKKNAFFEMHVDMDEANAGCISNSSYGYILV
ncbi:MAG: phosphate propanoyltransferase, partial [Ruminiclostridium sp.]